MLWKGPFCKFNVAGLGIFNTFCPANGFRRRQMVHDAIVHAPLDLMFHEIGELIAIRPKELDTIIFIGIVGSRNHNSNVSTHGTCEHRNRWSRQRAELEHVHPHRRKASHQSIFNHVARETRVFANHHPVTVITARKNAASGHADTQRHFCSHIRLVGRSANTIGAKILA